MFRNGEKRSQNERFNILNRMHSVSASAHLPAAELVIAIEANNTSVDIRVSAFGTDPSCWHNAMSKNAIAPCKVGKQQQRVGPAA